MTIILRCVPPTATAQQKRMSIVRGKPVFFHDAKIRRETTTWATLLAPYVPAEPLDGPIRLSIRLVYPHNPSGRKANRDRLVPKATRPDIDNVCKHLTDLLARMRFMVDDARVYRLCVEKFHGPEAAVGITIDIVPYAAVSS